MSVQLPTQLNNNGIPTSDDSASSSAAAAQAAASAAGQNLPLRSLSAQQMDVQDGYGAASVDASGRSSVLASLPPLPNMSQPSNYQANLQGASGKLTSFAAGDNSNATAAALAVVQNGGQIKPSYIAEAAKSSEGKKKTVEAQAESLTKSAEVSHKVGCHQQFDNHNELVGKLRAVGMNDKQAKTVVRLLEDGRVSDSAKSKISFELASLGVTAAGQNNTAGLSGNKDAVLSGLKSFADKEDGKLAAIGTDSVSANGFLNATPVGNSIKDELFKGAIGGVMRKVEGDTQDLAGASFGNATDQQAVSAASDVTLRPVLTQAQQAL